MTMLEKFLSFAEALPADRREAVEAVLAALMESHSPEHDLTAAERAEIDRRLAEPAPKFADKADIARLFGKPFAG